MNNLELFLSVALTGFSLILFVISAITYRRVQRTKLLFVSLAFALFLAKGLLLTLGLFIDSIGDVFHASVLVTMLDFGIMLFLYFSVVKK
ncbi:MAG: hypothetical protein DRI61_05650 [Chloroflexi bacterium]|nr:MAG: hypothetical protein DRI61_05650 [Chloroflexota bacterium]